MKCYKSFILLFALGGILSIKGVGDAIDDGLDVIDEFQGVVITPQSLLTLDTWDSSADKSAIHKWAQENADMLNYFAGLSVYGNKQARKALKSEVDHRMMKEELINKSDHGSSFIFIIEVEVEGNKKNFVIKIAAPGNRRENYNAFLERPHGTLMTKKEFELLQQTDNSSTYQGISRVATSLLAQDVIKNKNLSRVDVPKAHLLHIPGRPTSVEDANYVVVEEFVSSKGTLLEAPRAFLKVIEEFEQLKDGIGLWAINQKKFTINQHGKVVYWDLEQPNNSNPLNFFNKDRMKFKELITGTGAYETRNMIEQLKRILDAREQCGSYF